MENRKVNRLNREKMLIAKEPSFNVRFDEHDQFTWYVDFVAPEGTVYAGEKYTWADQTALPVPQQLRALTSRLTLRRSSSSARRPNTSTFTRTGSSASRPSTTVPSPDWSAAMNVVAVCQSIISMLSSAKEKAG